MMLKTTIEVTAEVEVPAVPEVFRMANGAALPIAAVTVEGLRGVAALVDGGRTVEQVADHLGKPVAWVARRASIARLAPAIRDAFEDAKSPIAKWTATHLELVARLPEHVQLAWWKERKSDSWRYQRLGNIATRELSEALKDVTRELSRAPWPLDAVDVAKGCGACDKCPMRTSMQVDMFEDFEPKKGDRCLDEGCWERKAEAFRKAHLASVRAKHPDLVIVADGMSLNEEKAIGAVSKYEYRACKKSERGAVPTVEIHDGERVGGVVWMKKGRAPSVSGAMRPKAKPEEVRERKRVRHMCEALGKLLEAAKYEDLTIEKPRQVFALALAFRSGFDDDADWKRFEKEKGRTLGQIGERVWLELVEGQVAGLVRYNPVNVPTVEAIMWVAGLIGTDYAALRAAAEKAVPEPVKRGEAKVAQKGAADPAKASGKAKGKGKGAKK
jgi:hypothetical protein